MITVTFKENWKTVWKQRHLSLKRKVDEASDWILNRPTLCCTWSCGSCERPLRVSPLDAAVSDACGAAVSPRCFLSFYFKGVKGCCFSSCVQPFQLKSVLLLFSCPDSITSLGLVHWHMTWAHWATEMWRNCLFLAWGLLYMGMPWGFIHSQTTLQLHSNFFNSKDFLKYY